MLFPSEVEFRIPFMKQNDMISNVQSLAITKATGLDGMTPKILKTSAEIIGPNLLKIINISIKNGQFPDTLKVAKLFPIHKNGLKSDPSNYRPVSILPVVSKVIEKHITKHLFSYLNKYKLLHQSQSGFCRKHSCNTALINLINRWLKHIDKGDIVGAIFFDLRKAFDIVDHELLMKKLSIYKFSQTSLGWIKSYLSGRKQCILDKEISSSLQLIRSGVPQGSVLGPVLFLIFINDLPLFTEGANVDIYADDTTMHVADKDRVKIEKSLQQGANGFKRWCTSNNMLINTHKTTLMTLGARQNLSRIETVHVYLDEDIIKEVNHEKLLGIIIDRNLTWDKQIDAVCLNVTRRITLLKLLSKYVNKSGLKQYYNSYSLPVLDYGCLIWGHCSNLNINRLVKLQERAARIILSVDYTTPSNIMFRDLNWLPFTKRFQYHTCVMMYKALNDLAPEYISSQFSKTLETHSRHLRSVDNELLRVPYSRTCYFEKSFTVDGAKQWNNLPVNLRTLPNLNSFLQNI